MGRVAEVFFFLILITVIAAICVLIYLVREYFARRADFYDKAERKCYDYIKFACNLNNTATNKSNTSDRPSNLITGVNAEEEEFPHVAYLSINTNDNKKISCGGSLISDEFILTAAQCVQNTSIDGISVKLGSVFRSSNKTGEFFSVSKINIHEYFSKDSENTYFNDIALLQLSKKVSFSSTVRPICLSQNVGYKNLDFATASEWGIGINGKISDRLKKLKVFVGKAIQSECEKVWGYYFGFYDEMICAVHPKYDKGLCQGDFGAPLQKLFNSFSGECPNVYEQIGIASMTDNQCTPDSSNEMYAVAYTKIPDFIAWIVNITWPG